MKSTNSPCLRWRSAITVSRSGHDEGHSVDEGRQVEDEGRKTDDERHSVDEGRPVEDEGRPAFIEKSIANTEYAEKLFGWHHETSLRDGIAHVLERHGFIAKSPVFKYFRQ